MGVVEEGESIIQWIQELERSCDGWESQTNYKRGIKRVVPRNYDPKGKRFLIASRFPFPSLLCAFFFRRATSTRLSARNLLPPLDNPELTIRRRSRTNPTLLNDSKRATEGNGDLPSIKVNGVTDKALRLYLFPHSLTRHATTWFDRLPRNSINTFEQMAKMFLGKYFPPSMVTKLRNEITNFRQRPDESLFEAWEHYKLSIDRCPNHNMLPVNQIDTFYNGLTLRHRDTINAAAGGTVMKRCLEECYDLIENMTAHHNDWDTSAQQSESSSFVASSSYTKIAALKAEMAKINKNLMRVLQVNQQVKAVTPNCETCGGPHSFSDCSATIGNTQNVYDAGAYQVERETEVTKDTVHPTNNGSTEDIQPPVVPTESPILNSEPVVAPIIEPVASLNKLLLPDLSPTSMTLELVDRLISRLAGVAEDVFVQMGTIHFPADFVVVDFDADPRVPLIHRRSFLKTERALIDVFEGELTRGVGKEAITFNLDQTSRYSANYNDMTANRIDVIDMACEEYSQEVLGFSDVIVSGNPTPYYVPTISTTSLTLTQFRNSDFLLKEVDAFLTLKDDPTLLEVYQSYELKICKAKSDKSSIDEPPEVELKDLHPHLEYVFLEGDDKFPVIIAKDLSVEEKTALITVLKSYKRAIAWKLSDIRAGLIYPISDSPWVSPVHYVSKNGGFTVVENEENELIPTRLVMGWRVYIDYRKLNEATHKDHFPLPFMDQMLERLAGNQYYCFLDGFFGYFQIPIDPKDQEKITFTCPYRMFAYRRMPFGLCNAPGTFQRCMMAIFHDMIKKTMEVFMDDFSVFRNSFQTCLSHLEKMLKWCEDTNLCLNWEKSHFMVKEVRPMTRLLEKDTPLFFLKDCVEAFQTLKRKLIEAPILIAPDWYFPFELMCDASDFAIGGILGQHQEKHFRPIHYASKTMTEAKSNYTTIEKEMLAVVKYILVTVDYLSKWVKAKAFPTNDARVVVKFLKSLFSRFETPKAIINDRGTHFCNDQFSRVMLKYGVTHRLSTAYHPQTSRQVEVTNRGLKRILKRTINENRALWSDKLEDALWAFRIAFKNPIGCTPYRLVYGKSCHLPLELEHKALWALKHANFDLKTVGDHRKLQLNELSELRDQAYENSLIYKERTKKLHDAKIKIKFSTSAIKFCSSIPDLRFSRESSSPVGQALSQLLKFIRTKQPS
uniref:Reverse transcriptase domain-containing protein n=1 Tax=Tanacetum cinerariifolium TaxID=118510 RepID=A0A6L2JUS2_TANCI|nr:reverse transcriptase domain-containing protein [Tanacetum cinerariifolium]